MEPGERAEPTSAATCVVWCPIGTLVPPRPLIQALASKGFSTIHCDDAFEALARLCVCVASREPGKRAVSLVVIDRQRLGEIDDFLEALETYTPSVVPWDYDDSLGLRPLVIKRDEPAQPATDLAPGLTPESAQGLSPGSASPPQLKMTESLTAEDVQHQRPAPSDENRHDDDEPTFSQLLTDEELAMLLGDDEPPAETDAGEIT